MKFFVDTADLAEIRDLAATGLLDGVTTNPSLIAKSLNDDFFYAERGTKRIRWSNLEFSVRQPLRVIHFRDGHKVDENWFIQSPRNNNRRC